MDVETYFYDTYAFCEIIGGNSQYKRFSTKARIITTKLNLMELHYGLLLKHGKENADRFYDFFCPYTVEVNDSIIKLANEFRCIHKKRKLSYVDCIGYIIAKLNNIKFLTGDLQFKDMDNVEYVK